MPETSDAATRRLIFRDKRERLGLTQSEFEALLTLPNGKSGWPFNSLSLIEKGIVRPEESQWEELFETLRLAEEEWAVKA